MALFHGTCYNYNFLTMPFFFFWLRTLRRNIPHSHKITDSIILYCDYIWLRNLDGFDFNWRSIHIHKMIYHQAKWLTKVTKRYEDRRAKTLTRRTLYQQVGHFMIYYKMKQ